MKEALTHLGWALPLCLLVGFVFHEWRDGQWFDAYEWVYKKNRYYFEGLQKRDLIDLCYPKTGEAGIFFKEDCDVERNK